jgi:prevent-host-death family protein
MRIAFTKAKEQLAELTRRAQAGEEVILTRYGKAVVRLVPIEPTITSVLRRRLLEAVRAAGAAKALPGANAATSQDFLYDADEMPQ